MFSMQVLDAGRLKEFDAPYSLLKKPRTLFSQLVTQTGPNEAKRLYEIARETFYKQKTIPEIDEEVDEEPEIETEENQPVQVALVVRDAISANNVQFETNI